MSFDAIPGLLSAIYFGTVADTHGHRLVLTSCCVGYLLAMLWLLMTCFFYETLPISATLFSSVFLFIGGGPLVFAAVIAALLANLVKAESRTKYLFLLAAMPHFGKLISPPIATLLMGWSLYLPSMVSGAIVACCILLLQLRKRPEHAQDTSPIRYWQSSEPLLDSNESSVRTESCHLGDAPSDVSDELPMVTNGPTCIAEGTLVGPFIPRTLHRLKNVAVWLSHEPVFRFCFLTFFLKSNAMASEAFIFQYLSEKFGWRLQDTTILRFALSSGAVLSTLVIGPFTSSSLVRAGVPTFKIDLVIVYISLLILTICFIFAWRAKSSTLFILSMLGAGSGEGLEPALQGLLSVVVKAEEMGLLFGIVYMCSLLGDMTGGPLMSTLMSIGRSADSPSATASSC